METPNAPVVRGCRGIALAKLDQTSAAEEELATLARLVELSPSNIAYFRAAVTAHLGRSDEAVALLRQAIRAGRGYWAFTISFHLANDPLFEPLWGYQPYEALVGPQG